MVSPPSPTGAPGAEGRGLGLVVPLYNEEERFAEYASLLVDYIIDQPAGSELVFVDDGSTDETATLVAKLAAEAAEAPVRLVRRPHVGKGAAVAAGLATSRAPWLGFCDLDLSTPLDQFDLVVQAARRAPVLAVGSRDLAGSRLLRPESRVRETLGRSYNWLLQVTITPGVVDTQCGAKVASRGIWEALLPRCREVGYAWDAEAIAVARRLRIGVQEVPIEWRHDDRSRVRVGQDGLAMVWATARIWRNVRRTAGVEAPPARAVGGGSSGSIEADGVFDDDNAEALMEADSTHWWFRSKAALVASALRRTRPLEGGRGWLVDVGAGAGGVTALLGWDPGRVVVVEGNEALVGSAVARHGLTGCQAVVDAVPLRDGAAEVVCLLDVIEHLSETRGALVEAARVLAPGGRLVVNVPAHRWLWSEADVALGHVRRYTRVDLRAELEAAGFRPVLLSHVFSWLVAPVWLKRRLASGGAAELGLDQTSSVLDVAAIVLTKLERSVLGRLSLPFGTSILCLARTSDDAPAHPSPHTVGTSYSRSPS